MPEAPQFHASARVRLFARVAVFALIEVVLLILVGQMLLNWAGYLITASVSTFVAAFIANALTLRIYERRPLADIGLHLSPRGAKHFGIGLAAGIVAGAFVCGLPLLFRQATLVPAPEQPGNWYSILFVTVMLFIAALGEEMLFRGYGFQTLIREWGMFGSILPVAVVFAWAHSNNPDITMMGLVNTFAWGVLLGFAFLRSGDLWLPVGLHFGWNWALPMFGDHLSGFKMGVTGYALKWNKGFAETWLSGGAYGTEGSVLTLLIVPALFWALWKVPLEGEPPYLLRDLE